MQALDINSGNYADVDIRSDRVFDQETLILELGKLFLNILWFNCDAAQFLLCGHLCGHLCVYVCLHHQVIEMALLLLHFSVMALSYM